MLRITSVFLLILLFTLSIFSEESLSAKVNVPTLTPLARNAIEDIQQKQLIRKNCDEKFGTEIFNRTAALRKEIDSLLKIELSFIDRHQGNSQMTLLVKQLRDIEQQELTITNTASQNKSSDRKDLELKRKDAIQKLQNEKKKIEEDSELVKIRKMLNIAQKEMNDSISNIVGKDEICKKCYNINR